jgi:hypothetical protein
VFQEKTHAVHQIVAVQNGLNNCLAKSAFSLIIIASASELDTAVSLFNIFISLNHALVAMFSISVFNSHLILASHVLAVLIFQVVENIHISHLSNNLFTSFISATLNHFQDLVIFLE